MTTLQEVLDKQVEEAKKEEALYNEFKARQAFDSLDQAIDRMKGASSVAGPE